MKLLGIAALTAAAVFARSPSTISRHCSPAPGHSRPKLVARWSDRRDAAVFMVDGGSPYRPAYFDGERHRRHPDHARNLSAR